MSCPVLILRPEPGASATAERARALGLEPIVLPLFDVRPLAWEPPSAEAFDAVMMTSANAARHGGAGLAYYQHLPLHAVGAATAEAARGVGFREVIAHRGDAATLIEALRGKACRVLHLAGREHRAAADDAVAIERRIVYAAEIDEAAAETIVRTMDRRPVALLHSPRAARVFGDLLDRFGVDRAMVGLATLSPAVLDAAGEGWAQAKAAVVPTDDALLAVAARLCD